MRRFLKILIIFSISVIIYLNGGISVHPNSEKLDVLVDLKDFNYLLESSVCDAFDQKKLLGVIIVTSYVGHVKLRDSHRQSISQSELNQMGLARVFLVAEIPQHEKNVTQGNINSEFKMNNDLVQGNFQDAYRNNTYKNIMGLKWASEKCSKATFIIKIDDDTVYDVFFFQNFLKQKETDLIFDRNNFLAGRFSSALYVLREKSGWAVSVQEFPDELYPPFLSGMFYITTPEVARKLITFSESTSFFWIDDVYITGILRNKANITVTEIGKWIVPVQFLKCIRESEKFTVWANYSCNYHVGYDNGDSNLLILYTELMRQKNLHSDSH